jgi:putative peptide zinc metalloprotease protein
MATETPAADVERRKQVRLRVRADLSIAPQKYEGRTYFVVKDPVSLRYYRFKEQEHFLIQLMDGTHTLDQAQKEFEKRFRPDRLTLEDLEQFGQQLLTAGLAQNESPGAGKQLFDRRKKRRRKEILQAFTNILYIKIPIFDPERLLTRMLPYFRWMFSMWFFLFSVGVMLAAIMLVLTHFQTFRDRLPSYHEFFSFKTVIYLWAALGVVKVIHEFGHGLSCKAFGGEVHEMGFLILCLSPAMYCNVSDAWTLPNKWKRIIISGAGIYVELMIAAIATFVWWNTPGQPFVNYMALSLMVVCSVSTILFNGNPLMRFDGYYVLADWLEIPNLRDRSNKYIQRIVMDKCLGIEVQPEPYMERWRRVLFVTYAITSYIYRWLITFVILMFLSNFLGPKLKIISQMLATVAVGTMIGWPLYRLGANLKKRGRLPDMKPARVAISASVLAALLLFVFFVPLPITSRVRETGLVQVQPDYIEHLHVEVPGILEKIHVKEGEKVRKGMVLAEFSSLDLESQYEDARSQYLIKRDLITTLDTRVPKVRDPKEQQELKKTKTEAQAAMNNAQRQMELLDDSRKRLVLRARRNGTVMGLPKVDEIGRMWDAEQGTPFCSIGDPTHLRILVPVSPDDYDLVRQNLDKLQEGQQLPVTIRVQGRDSKLWTGRVGHLPRQEAREVPLALTNRGGGPLAVRPSSDPKQLAPQNQVYLVGIDFEDPDTAVCPGVLAQVKVHNDNRSIAWWIWRTLSKTFDLAFF